MGLSLLSSLFGLLLAGLMSQVGAKKGGGRRAVFRTELLMNLRNDFTLTEKHKKAPSGGLLRDCDIFANFRC